MHRAFRDGFEKCALLWSAGKDPAKFQALAQGLAKQRAVNEGMSLLDKSPIKTSPVTSFIMSKVLKRPYADVRNMMSEGMTARGAHSMLDSKVVVVPQKPLGHLHPTTSSIDDGIRPIITHHELDEAQLAAKNGVTERTLKRQKTWSNLKDAIKYGPKKAALMHAQHGTVMGNKGFMSHVAPDVLLRESNRVFHEGVPDAAQFMQRHRTESGEAGSLLRHGLRYGEEYIPEGGRRWRKLTSKLEGKMVEPRDLPGGKTHNAPA